MHPSPRASLRPLQHALSLGLATLLIPAVEAQVQITSTVTVPTDQSSPWDIGNDLYVGFIFTDGTLNIQSGSAVTNTYGYIGYAANGTVNVDGAGSTWTNLNELRLGNYYSSIGQLNLTGGATASADLTVFGTASSNSQGKISIDGPGSSFTTGYFYLGESGSGSLSVTGGGTFATTVTWTSNHVGHNAGSSGAITVSGTGSTFTNASDLFLGSSATGTMTVADGAHASSARYTYLGYQNDGTGTLTVNGTDAVYTAHDYIWNGYNGNGTLIVKDGGAINFDSGSTQRVIQLGVNSGSSGTLKIGDGGAAGTIAAAIAGGSGTGQVVFNHTGAVGGGTYIFASTIEGGIDVVHRGPGATSLTGANTYTGSTTIEDGTLLANNTTGSAFGSGSVTVQAGATLGGSGFIDGPTTLESGAHLAPGNSPGTLSFTNGLTLNDGAVLDFQLGTTSDLIRVSGGTLTGSASAGGITLNLSNAGGFTAASYTLFDFSGATTSSFTASDFILGSTVSGYTYSLALVGSTLQLTAVPEPATTAALLGAAALSLAAYRRQRRASVQSRAA
ncbi:MAG: autotransporter-associated beta strand repeat-containing protein [Opitutae bacterium]|nr:autotransporter-associated beta strand repeat-containing protein [Opitutae bacterium]